VDACKAILAYLNTGEIRGAVNAGGIKLDLPADEMPFADLARRMGQILPALCDTGYTTITLRVHGQRPQKLATTLMRLATVELLKANITESINVINVEHFARSRGIELAQIAEAAPPAGLVGEVLELRVELPGGETHRILGTVYQDRLPRVVRIDHFAMDMVPEGQMVLIENSDQPGVIGMVGKTFGSAEVNIANMTISRGTAAGGDKVQLQLIKTDSAAPQSLIDALKANPNIRRAKKLRLPELAKQ
jgi:D-3-phosphoglycerate dehydrogenase